MKFKGAEGVQPLSAHAGDDPVDRTVSSVQYQQGKFGSCGFA